MTDTSLEKRIQRLEDVHQIQNIWGRYAYWHVADMHENIAALFATKTPGVKAQISNWGVYEGVEGIKRLYIGVHKYLEGDRVGRMHMHTLTTPVIEVAGDGKTAKGLWISTGHETSPRSEGKFADGTDMPAKFKVHWAWCKYAIDFVKEDSQWKVWHAMVSGIFFTPFEKSWVEIPDEHPIPPMPKELMWDSPSQYHWMYNTNVKTENIPAPPEPYETWDDSMAYLK